MTLTYFNLSSPFVKEQETISLASFLGLFTQLAMVFRYKKQRETFYFGRLEISLYICTKAESNLSYLFNLWDNPTVGAFS